MSFAIARLLIDGDLVSAETRAVLKAAYEAAPERRSEMLVSAARVLHDETHLACDDVRELVGLVPDDDGAS